MTWVLTALVVVFIGVRLYAGPIAYRIVKLMAIVGFAGSIQGDVLLTILAYIAAYDCFMLCYHIWKST